MNQDSASQASNTSASNMLNVCENGNLLLTAQQLLAVTNNSDNHYLVIKQVSAPSEQGSILAAALPGVWIFAPKPNFTGIAKLSFSGTNGAAPITQDFNVNVLSTQDFAALNKARQPQIVDNNAPIIQAAKFDMQQDGTLLITGAKLLEGAYDKDNDQLTVVSVHADPQYGLISNGKEQNTWIFTPNASYFGDAELSYTATDGKEKVHQVIEVKIEPKNEAPKIKPVACSMQQSDQQLVITSAHLLQEAYDADNDQLKVTKVSVNPEFGSVNAGATPGTWVYIPSKNLLGDARLSYVVTDGSFNVSETITVSIKA